MRAKSRYPAPLIRFWDTGFCCSSPGSPEKAEFQAVKKYQR